jgi:hypothetical protein
MPPDLSPDAWAQIRHDYEMTERPISDICAEHGISSGTLRDRMRRWGWTRRRPPIPAEGPPAAWAASRYPFSAGTPSLPSPANGGGIKGGRGGGIIEGAALAAAKPEWPRSGEARSGGGNEGEYPAPQVAQAWPAPADETDGAYPSLASTPTLPSPASGGGIEEKYDGAIVPRLQGAVARVLPAIEANLARIGLGTMHPREMEQAGRALSSLTRTLRELNTLLTEHQARAPVGRRCTCGDPVPDDIDEFRHRLALKIDALVAAHKEEAENAAEPEAS